MHSKSRSAARVARRGPVWVVAVATAWIALTAPAGAQLPTSFQDTIVWSGLTLPTAVRFAPDGRVFVAEKSGIIKVFDSLADTTPTVFADLTAQVHDWIDRGLNGIAVDPGFPVRPYVYAFFTVDAPPGMDAPYYNDFCAVEDGCVARSRLVRLTASGDVAVAETILIEANQWCEISVMHASGDLVFGADGYLYVSHGDGSTASQVDYGQVFPCAGDPPQQGGALKAQDLRTSGDPTSFDGAIIRVDPDTGAAAPGNPLAGGAVADDDPIVAYGLRNPFRFSIDPSTGRLWIADVGWALSEEIDLVQSAVAPVKNFGWPCYEGASRQQGYEAANLPLCQSLYAAGTGAVEAPYARYDHPFAPGAISGIALYRGQNFPASYDGALFYTDYTQGWIKVMIAGANGLPNPNTAANFVPSGVVAVDLQVGPGGELFYVDVYSGDVHMIKYSTNDAAPDARVTTDATAGALPLTVHFDGTGSSDPEGQVLSYAWDLDGDGAFDDGVGSTATFVYTSAGPLTARLRVTDPGAHADIATVVIAPGVSPPQLTIATPVSSLRFQVGEAIQFSGSALDPDSGQPIPAADLTWQVLLDHCAVGNPQQCHEHFVRRFTGVAGGTIIAPDHEYPAFLRLVLTASKPIGGGFPPITRSISQDVLPSTTTLTFVSEPSGLQLAVYGAVQTAPFTRTAIVGAKTTVSAPTPQSAQGVGHTFSAWSDGGAQTHLITAGSAPATFTAAFVAPPAFTSQPSFRVAVAGGDTAFVANAYGAPLPAYQWQVSTNDGGSWTDLVNGGLYSGATAATLVLTGVPLTLDRAQYRVVATNGSGTVTSGAANLWVTDGEYGVYWRDPGGISGGGGTPFDGTDITAPVTPGDPPPTGGRPGGEVVSPGPVAPSSPTVRPSGPTMRPSSRPGSSRVPAPSPARGAKDVRRPHR